MPNQRSSTQHLVAFPVEKELLDIVDRQRGRESRSQFIRDALAAYLERMGIRVDDSMVAAPDRAGKRHAATLAAMLAEDSASAVPLSQEPVKYEASKRKKKS